MFLQPAGIEGVLAIQEQLCTAAFGVDRYPLISDKAAALLYHLILDHLMVDGNKRFAMVVAEMFLAKNGYEWKLTPDEYVGIAVAIADPMTRMPLDEVRLWMASHVSTS